MNETFSVIIPVLNEAPVINHTVEHARHIGAHCNFEIIVVDGDAEGRTINKIKHSEALTITARRGRGTQMNAGATIAKGDILIFLHTDTKLPMDAFTDISAALCERNYDAGAFTLGIESDRFTYRVIEKMVSIRSGITKIPYGDQAIFVKKKVFTALGGFQEIPLMEDVEFMRRLKKNGYSICVLPKEVKTSARRWEQEGIFYCTVRNWLLITLYLAGVRPEKLVRFYYRNEKSRSP